MLAAVIGAATLPTLDAPRAVAIVVAAIVLGTLCAIPGAALAARVRVPPLAGALVPFAVAVLPDGSAIGLAAPILLLVLRLALGFALGGEIAAAPAAAPPRRGRSTSWLAFAAVLGIGAAVLGTNVLTALLGPDALASWGWRVPFAVSAVLLALAYRRATPVRTLPGRRVGLAMIGAAAPAAAVGAVLVYAIPAGDHGVLVHLLPLLVLVPLAGELSDVIGRRKAFLAASAFLVLFTVPAFALAGRGDATGVVLAWLLLAVPGSLALGSLFAARAELAAGSSVPLVAGLILFGGGSLLARATLEPVIGVWADQVPLLAAGVVGLVTAVLVREPRGEPSV